MNTSSVLALGELALDELSLYEITVRCTNDTLRSLSRTILWNIISNFCAHQEWWYRRTEYLVGRSLISRVGEWSHVYRSISNAGEAIFIECQDYSSKLLVPVLLELGADPTTNYEDIVSDLAYSGCEEAIVAFFSDPRVDPTSYDNAALKCACRYGNGWMLNLLLSNPQVDPTIDQQLASIIIDSGYDDILQKMLQYECNSHLDSNELLLLAVIEERTEIAIYLLSICEPSRSLLARITKHAAKNCDIQLIERLTSDGDVSRAGISLDVAISHGHTVLVRSLLKICSPKLMIREFLEAVQANKVDTVKLLLEDGRLNISESNALGVAITHNSNDMIQLLWNKVSLHSNHNYALRMARKMKRVDVEKLLLQDDTVRSMDESEKNRARCS